MVNCRCFRLLKSNHVINYIEEPRPGADKSGPRTNKGDYKPRTSPSAPAKGRRPPTKDGGQEARPQTRPTGPNGTRSAPVRRRPTRFWQKPKLQKGRHVPHIEGGKPRKLPSTNYGHSGRGPPNPSENWVAGPAAPTRGPRPEAPHLGNLGKLRKRLAALTSPRY